MSFLTQIKIQTRIIILVLIPLLATLALSIERLNNTYNQQQQMQKLDTVLDYANVTYPLIAGTLQEAFYSRLYIDSKNNKVTEYKQKMLNARRSAINSQSAYINFINTHKDKLTQFPVLNTQLEQIKKSLANFKYLRMVADSKQHSSNEYKQEFGSEIHTMYQMNFVIRRLVLSLNEIVVIATQNETLGKMSNAYYNLVVASVERSVHDAFIFTAMNTVLDVYVFGEIYSAATKTNSYQELFLNFASEHAKQAYFAMINNQYYKLSDKVALQARSNIYNNVNKPLVLDNINWDQTTSKVFEIYQQTIDASLKELIETKNRLIIESENLVFQTFAIMISLLIIIALISFLIARSITHPLKKIVKSFNNLAINKNMGTRLNSEGNDELTELGQEFNKLLASFNTTLNGVKQETNQINLTTEEVVNAMEESASLSNSQLQATDSISVAINQMTATISEVANMASNTSNAVQKAHDISVTSSNNAERSRKMMENLTDELGNTNTVINKLNDESNLIGNVLSVIQGIAEQTNLLALNAAIEAARAGETGRGFAVVADEVRNLAGRTQESTKQIQTQIETLQKGAAEATNKMESLQTEGNKAVQIVIESAQAFNVMKTELDNIMLMATQIATASEEQTSVSNEINERIFAIRDDADKITHKTTETRNSAQQMKETGHRLNQYINEFKLN